MPMDEYIKLSIGKISFTDRMRDILWGIGEFFANIRRKVTWGWQRLFRGYDDSCEWALDDYLNPIVLHHLRYHRARIDNDKMISIPWYFSNGKDMDTATAEWRTVLDIMIDGFEIMISGNMLSCDTQIMRDRREKMDRALELFGKHYQSLWT